jgi:hypothetical protein
LPEPDVETAPDVVEQPTEEAVADETPVEEVTETAPEEATTEIVTEAEEPAAALSPTSSVRPTARPARPEPVEEPVEEAVAEAEVVEDAPVAEEAPAEEEDPLAAAIAGAVADAVATPDPAPASAPAGPPLSQGTRDGFRVAVGGCWNLGTTSSDAMRTTVVVAFDMEIDGRPINASMRLLEWDGPSQAAADVMYEAARRAIIRCTGEGYDLPEESYGRWQQVELVFNPEGMRLR